MSLKYTQDKRKFIEEDLNKKMAVIVKIIKKRIKDTKSIVLAGGFGRGEGSVIVEDGIVYPINDFDMFAITKQGHKEETINNIAQEAAKKIGKLGIPSFVVFNKYKIPSLYSFFYIDLKVIPLKRLKELPPMARYYELRNASQTVYGDNLIKKIPKFEVKNIPLAEGIRLLMNRMSHMIEFFYPQFITKKTARAAHEIFLLHAIKTYLASCTSLLLLSGKYKPSYRERLEILKRTFDRDFKVLKEIIPDFPKKVKEFTDLKLNMDFNAYKDDDLELWEVSRYYIGEVVKYFLSKFSGQGIKNWENFSAVLRNKTWQKYYSPYIQYFINKKFKIGIKNKLFLTLASILAQLYLNLIYFIRIKKYHKNIYFRCLFKLRSPELTFFSAAPLILYSLEPNGKVNLEMLNKGKNILKKTFPVKVKYQGDDLKYWEKIAHAYSNAYILFSFLKIV